MADKDLFNGHKYIFTKVSSSLVMEDSTDNSHEKITFREGLISSSSIEIMVPGDEAYGLKVHNYHPTSQASGDRGIEIRCGDETVTQYFIYFYDGDNTYVGRIRGGSGTVYYDTFTGVHRVRLLDADSVSANIIPPTTGSEENYYIYKTGTILSVVKSELPTLKNGSTTSQPIEYCIPSSTHQDKRVLGVYTDSDIDGDDISDYHTCASLGDGIILVCSQNGNIENGDYITTASGSGGYGCKQNSEFLANYTVAKSLEDVDWSTEPSSSKLIACTYHCG